MFTRIFPIRSLVVCAVLISVSAVVCLPLTARTRAAFSADAWSDADRGAIDHKVFALALGAAACAVKSRAIDNPSTLTIIDYSQPSTERRLWVFDLQTQALLYEELVAHGKESGDNMATRFSNELNSHQSSLGLFLTGDTYVGRNGYSLRLRGLDEGFNDRARERAIVMHGAPYVNDDIGRTMGRLGRSWGCPALREGVARAVIDRVKGTGILFAYYPDSEWLKSSKYLNDCQTAAHSTN